MERIAFQGDKLWVGPLPDGLEAALHLPEGVAVHRVAPEAAVPDGVRLLGLREAWGEVDEIQWRRAGRAWQWLQWEAAHRRCGACGEGLEAGEGQGRRCPGCGLQVFPAASTAVIVAIRRGRELALARSPHFRPGVYSAVAGFTEPGESLEEAVHREVAEELGIRIHRLRYFGSQPWPFPNGLMVGFLAEHLDGELSPDPAEIEDARWFGPGDLPVMPAPYSIARRLLEASLAEIAAL